MSTAAVITGTVPSRYKGRRSSTSSNPRQFTFTATVTPEAPIEDAFAQAQRDAKWRKFCFDVLGDYQFPVKDEPLEIIPCA